MSAPSPTLQPGTLWQRVRQQTEFALQQGALLPIPTQTEQIVEAGIPFRVSIIENLARKDQAKRETDSLASTPVNPFLPYEENLCVAALSDTHVCLLNKYNVVDYHLLIITRAFEEQESLLTVSDFAALWQVLEEIDGLGFYNSGKDAGASQPHKHLQLVPLPLHPGEVLPIAPWLDAAQFNQAEIGTLPGFDFLHGLRRLDGTGLTEWERATMLCHAYQQLLAALGVWQQGRDRPQTPYNLLVTRNWMLLIPRSQECCQGISINALGFAGAILLRSPEQLEPLKTLGPRTILQQVAICTP